MALCPGFGLGESLCLKQEGHDGECGWAAQPITVLAMDWPRYPTLTKTGKESKAKRAGKLIPWLSVNVIKRMAEREHHNFIQFWRETAREKFSLLTATGRVAPYPPYYLDVLLMRPGTMKMDVLAIAEGCKPIIDGAVLAGVLEDDSSEFVCGVLRCQVDKSSRPGIVISLVPASEAAEWLAMRHGSHAVMSSTGTFPASPASPLSLGTGGSRSLRRGSNPLGCSA